MTAAVIRNATESCHVYPHANDRQLERQHDVPCRRSRIQQSHSEYAPVYFLVGFVKTLSTASGSRKDAKPPSPENLSW